MFTLADITILPEAPEHADAIEAITEEAFGPGRYARAAERMREMAPHDPALSFVADYFDAIVGSVRLTPIAIGTVPSLMLGPLAVRPPLKGKGVGKALMRHAADAARAAGWETILLVGDLPYYWPLGYRPVPPGRIVLPRPVDPARVLLLELQPRAGERVVGEVGPLLSERR